MIEMKVSLYCLVWPQAFGIQATLLLLPLKQLGPQVHLSVLKQKVVRAPSHSWSRLVVNVFSNILLLKVFCGAGEMA